MQLHTVTTHTHCILYNCKLPYHVHDLSMDEQLTTHFDLPTTSTLSHVCKAVSCLYYTTVQLTADCHPTKETTNLLCISDMTPVTPRVVLGQVHQQVVGLHLGQVHHDQAGPHTNSTL